jgi:Phosphate/sulphate permeases
MIQLYIIIALALTFDFINGFHDTANAIATAVSTRALRLKYAIMMAAVMNFIGAVLFTGVAKTIATGVVDIGTVQNGMLVVMAAMISAILWNLLTWYFGIPSSSSHALIGSLAGAALADAGVAAVNFKGFITIFASLIISPLIAICVGYILFKIIMKLIVKMSIYKANSGLRKVQIFTAALQAFSHGSNDAQKSMGIITMALVSYGYLDTMTVPHWVQLACAAAMTLGTSVGGWRIIKTVGTQIMKLKPINGVAADLSSSLIIQIATHLNLPVSTTHVISSSIIGVGTAQRIKGVKWGTARKMVIAWFITIPITICTSSGIFLVVNAIAQVV